MSAFIASRVIPLLTEPLVRTGIYRSSEDALKHIVLEYIERQIAWAEAEIRRFEEKHKRTFAEWSKSLQGRASIADEDDWMEWEAAIDMLSSWREIKIAVEQSDV